MQKSFWIKNEKFLLLWIQTDAPWTDSATVSKESSAFYFQDKNRFQDNWFPFAHAERFNFPHHFSQKFSQKMLLCKSVLVMTINLQDEGKNVFNKALCLYFPFIALLQRVPKCVHHKLEKNIVEISYGERFFGDETGVITKGDKDSWLQKKLEASSIFWV